MIKKILILSIAFILTLVVVKPYFHTGFPYTHDGENHLARFANYKIAFREGQIPPRFAPNLMNHYGYPVFNYNYPLANLLSLPFSFLKINYEITFKILAAVFILTGLSGVFCWLDKFKISYGAVLFGTITYAASPFIWSTILFRGNIGEIMAWGLFPWLLYLVESLRGSGGWAYKLKGLVMALFMLSHNISVVFGLPIVIIYSFFRHKIDKLFWTRFLSVLGFGIALSLWFWLPAVAEKNLVNVGDVALVEGFATHFPSLRQLFFSPLGFGFSLPGKVDSLSFSLGLIQIATLFLSGLILLKTFLQKNKNSGNNTLLKLFVLGSLLLILFQLEITLPIWKLVPLASFIQFPWRLSLFLSVLSAGVGSMLWSKISSKLKWLLLGLLSLQLLSFSKAKPVDYFHRNNIDYDAFSQSTTTNNENLPKDFTYEDIGDWQPTPKIINGSGEIKVDYWSGSRRQYQLELTSSATLVEPTMNFAGWDTVAFIDGEKLRIDYLNDDEIGGRVAYRLETPGKYKITTQFTQRTWPRLIGNGVSIVAILLALSLIFKKYASKDLNFYLNWKIFLFFVGLSAPLLFIYDPSFPYADSLLAKSGLPSFIYSWANFDGVHYLTILDKGYFGTGLIQAFFPLFPMFVGSLSGLLQRPIISGLIFNFVIGFLLLKVWKRVVDLEIGTKIKNWGVHLLFLFPTALFLNAFYSEALFLLLVLLSFLNARRGRWLRSGLVAALASATRLVGIFLIPALLVELWIQKTAEQKAKGNENYHHLLHFCQNYWREITSILLGALGLLFYMIYLQRDFNDPLYFYHVQSEFGGGRQESIVLYPQVVWRYLKILWTARPFDLKYYAYVQEFLFGTLGLVGIIWSWFKVRKSYVVFSALTFLLPTMTGTFSSMPRYFLVSFSVFLLLIKLFRNNKVSRYLWLSLSTLLLIFNTILFIQGYWVA